VLDAHVVYEDATLTFLTFDDEHHRVALLAARQAGASVEELSDRAWALKTELPNPLDVLMGG